MTETTEPLTLVKQATQLNDQVIDILEGLLETADVSKPYLRNAIAYARGVALNLDSQQVTMTAVE